MFVFGVWGAVKVVWSACSLDMHRLLRTIPCSLTLSMFMPPAWRNGVGYNSLFAPPSSHNKHHQQPYNT